MLPNRPGVANIIVNHHTVPASFPELLKINPMQTNPNNTPEKVATIIPA